MRIKKISTRVLFCALFGLLQVFVYSAQAASITWTNIIGGNWSAATNWSPNQVPQSNDVASITVAGTYTVVLDVAGTVNGLVIGGAASGVQTLQNSGLTLVATNATINSGGFLSFAGTLRGQATVASGGEVQLTGTTVLGNDANSATEWLTVQSGGLLTATHLASFDLETPMTNSGTMDFTNQGITVINSPGPTSKGALVNLSGGVINFMAGAGFNNSGTTLGTVLNQGLIQVSGGPSSNFNINSFLNQGTVSVLSGAGQLTVPLNGLGTFTGTYNAAAGTTVSFTAVISPGTSPGAGLTLSGAGLYEFSSGVLTLTTDIIPGLVLQGGTLELGPGFQGGSVTNLTVNGMTFTNTLPITGLVSLTGTLQGQTTVASGGELLLTGSVTVGGDANSSNEWLTVQSGGVLAETSAGGFTLNTSLTNSGVMTLTNVGLTVVNDGGATRRGAVVNLPGGLIDLASGAGIGSGGTMFGTVLNQGLIQLVNGSSTINVNSFLNQGTVSALSGASQLNIFLNGLGTFTGTYNAAAGTIIAFTASSNLGTSAGAGLSLNGTGLFEFTTGLLTMSTNVIPGLVLQGGNLALGPGFQGGAITNLTISGMTFSNTLPITGLLKFAGTLQGQTTVASGGELLLAGGVTVGGDANSSNEWLTVQSGGVLAETSAAGFTLNTSLTNSGVMTLTNVGLTVVNDGGATRRGAVVNLPGGVIDLASGAGIGSGGTTFGTVLNQGLIQLVNGSSTINVNSFLNQGTVSALSGASQLNVALNGLGTFTGTYNAAAGTIIAFTASSNPGTSAGAGLSLNGTGLFEFTTGLLTLTTDVIPGLVLQGGTLELGPGFQGGSVTNLTVSGLTFSNTLPITGLLKFAGTLQGQTTVASGGELLLTGSVTLGGDANSSNEWLTVQSGGVLAETSAGGFTLNTSLTNSGVMTLTNVGLTVINDGGATRRGAVVNLPGGLIDLASGAGIGNGGTTFGTVLNQGLIQLVNGSSTINVNSFLNQGTVSALSGASQLNVALNGLGTFTGTYNAAAGTIIAFTATGNPGTSPGAGLTLSGAGLFEFSNGLLTLTADVIPGLVLQGGTLALGPGFQGGSVTNLTVSGLTFSNTLPITGLLSFAGTLEGQITVASGGELLLTSTATMGGDANSSNEWLTVQSGGLLTESHVALFSLDTAMTNSGLMTLTNTLSVVGVGSSGNAKGALVNLAGGVIDLFAGAGIGNGGSSFGTLLNLGTIAAYSTNSTSTISANNFTNVAVLSAQHGNLTLAGANLFLAPTETLNVGLNSLTDFGTIIYNQSAGLNLTQAGTFMVTLNGGFVPAVSNSFRVLTASSTGVFSQDFTNFSSPNGAVWVTNYTSTSLTLTNVGQMTWVTPATITYGAALGAAQDNAAITPSLAGNFSYVPPAGTVLNSGNGQLLTGTFTPTGAAEAPASLQVRINVLKAPLGITATNQAKIYGQNFGFAGTEFVSSGLVNGDVVTSTTITSAGSISNAPVVGSPYPIQISAALGDPGLTNYITSYTNGAFTVNPAPLTITANNTAKTYGQTVIFAGTEFTSSALQNLETIGTVALASGGAVSNAPVSGSAYAIVPSGGSGGTFTPSNYAISYANGLLTVNRAALTVVANNAARLYGAANPLFTFSLLGLVNNETVLFATTGNAGLSTPATGASPIGSYSIVSSLGTLSAANYTFGSFANGTLAITTAPLSITASNRSKVYGQTVTFAGTEFGTSGLLNSDTVTQAVLTCAGAVSNAPVSGSPYSIVLGAPAGSGLTNYSVTLNNGTLTVSKAPLTITANNTAKTYGQTVTFAGTEFTSSALQNLETIGAVTLASGGAVSNAPVSGSAYAIVPSGGSGGTFTPSNYAISYANGLLTVNRAALTVVANNAARLYGAANPLFTFSLLGLVNNETVLFATTGNAGLSTPATGASPIGSYSIVSSLGTLSAANYTFGSFANGTLAITTAPLSITASNRSKVYGQTVTFAGTEFGTSGLLNSDTVTQAVLTCTGAVSNAPVSGSPYSIVLGAPAGSGLTNYSVTLNNGTLTVSKAPLTITANNTNKIAGQVTTFSGTEYISSGLQNLETIGSVTLASTGAAAAASPGSYNIIPSAPAGGTFSPGNYSDIFVNGTLTVSAKPLLAISLNGANDVLTFSTVLNEVYQIQSSTNLTAPNWLPLGSSINGTGNSMSATNNAASGTTFYRLQIQF